MANHKSSIKRIKQTIVKTQRNRFYKTRVKNITRSFLEAIEASDKVKATEIFATINKNFQKYVSKGVYKKGTMSRRIGRLNIKLNSLA
jgi:small subunit ribosomal protein S20